MGPDVQPEQVTPSIEKVKNINPNESEHAFETERKRVESATNNLANELKKLVEGNKDVDLSAEAAEFEKLASEASDLTESVSTEIPAIDKTSKEDDKDEGENPITEFKGVNKLLFQYLQSEGIRQSIGGKITDEKITIDFDKIIAITEENASEDDSEKGEPKTDQEKGEMLSELRNALPLIQQALVNRGIVLSDFIIQINRLITDAHIEVTDNDYNQFYYGKDDFPEKTGNNAALYIGAGCIEAFEDTLKDRLNQYSVALPSEIARKITLRWILSHEYGHAIDRTLQLGVINGRVNTEEGDTRRKIGGSVQDEMYQDVNENIAKNSDLESMVTNDEKTRKYLSPLESASERVASGFEFVGLHSALVENGVAVEHADAIIANAFKKGQDELQDFKRLLEYSSSHGLDMKELKHAMLMIRIELKKRGRQDLLTKLPLHFGMQHLGYLAPLTEQEITTYVSKYAPT